MIKEVAAVLWSSLRDFVDTLSNRTQQGFAQAAEPPTRRSGGHVVCYHPLARDVGEAILASGGNAFDAFVATTAAENVLSEGASSLAGALGVLIYRAADKSVSYLDADHDDPLDPDGLPAAGETRAGAAALVPGAPAALDLLASQHCRLPLDVLLAPAIALAEEGFPVGRLMAATIADRRRLLRHTAYGRDTFLANHKPLKVGDTLRLPELATWLRRFAQERSAFVYHGDFATRFIEAVQADGGRLTDADFANYEARWCVPWSTTYRDLSLHSCSARNYGGLWTLLALKTWEHSGPPSGAHYSQDPDVLERMMRTAREVWSESSLFDETVEDPSLVQALLTEQYSAGIWQRVVDQRPALATTLQGTHSFHIITTDDEGNIASGTTTVQSEAWADGLFVDGLLLTTSARFPFSTGPGRRRLCPFSMHLAMKNGEPQFSVGAISNSVAEAAFQLIVNLVDYHMPVAAAVQAPRFGTFPPDALQRPRLDRNWVDPAIDRTIVKTLRKRQLKLSSAGSVDTGLGAVLKFIGPRESVGATLPIPYLPKPFSTSPDDPPERAQ